MKRFSLGPAVLILVLAIISIAAKSAEAKFAMAHVSDSPSSSVPFWVAKEAGLFKKHGLDIDLLFINGSTRGVQSLIGSSQGDGRGGPLLQE